MPTINPVALVLLGPTAAVFIWVLVAFPAYPKSVIAKFAWLTLLLLVSTGMYFLFEIQTSFRTAPGKSELVTAFLVYLPFAASFLLWRSRRVGGPPISGQTSTWILVAVCVLSVTAIRQFNKSCVYHDFWNDNGEAWCAESWQSKW